MTTSSNYSIETMNFGLFLSVDFINTLQQKQYHNELETSWFKKSLNSLHMDFVECTIIND